VSLEDVRRFAEGGAGVPWHAVALTWDDGYRSFATVVVPLVRQLKMPAAVAVISRVADGSLVPFDVGLAIHCASPAGGARLGPGLKALVWRYVGLDTRGRESMLENLTRETGFDSTRASVQAAEPWLLGMGWDEVRRLLAEPGIAVLCHSSTHAPLSALGTDEVLAEMTECKRRTEEMTGTTCDTFVYPLGIAGPVARACAARTGFQFGFTTSGRPIRRGDDPLLLSRIEIPPFASEEEFICRVAGVGAWIAAVKRVAGSVLGVAGAGRRGAV
jgi:hypothetical protein